MSKYNFLGTSKEDTTFFKKDWKSAQSREDIKEIFIHDFAGGETLTAWEAAKIIYNRMASNNNSANVHWTVSKDQVCAIIPEKQSAYATGVMEHNQKSLNIEIAPSFTQGNETKWSNSKNKEDYYKAWETACKLTADICIKYDLTEKDVRQHREVRSTACPYTMKVYFGSYEKALSETRKQVKKEINALKGEVIKNKIYLKEIYKASGKYNSMVEIIDGDAMVYKDGNAKKPIGKSLKEITSTKHLAVRKSSTIKVDGKYWYMVRFMSVGGTEYWTCRERQL